MSHSAVNTLDNFFKKAATMSSQRTNTNFNSSFRKYNFVLLLISFKGSIEPNEHDQKMSEAKLQ